MGDVIEYVTINGRRFCPCSVAVLEMAEAGFKAAGILPATASIHSRITQGGYRAGATAASKGSHDRGGVVDSWFSLVNTDAKQRIWDQAGAVGCRRFSWEFTSTNTPDHGHIIAVGCPHLAEFAAEQLAEIRRGGDGMAGTRGWAGAKPSFTPWRTRYAAFKAQQEDDMPLTDSDLARVATAVWSATFGSATDTAGTRLASASLAGANTRPITRGGVEVPLRQEVADIKTMLLALSAVADVEEVDEEQLAQHLATLVAPVVRDAVVAAVEAGGTPTAIADAVFERIGGAFAAAKA